MRSLHLTAVALLGAALLAPARAAEDLAAIPRTIAKEPKYAGKPAYCLLALGAEGKTRIWLVRDGDTAYVDRNGNGDLTEADEKVAGTSEVDDSEEMKSTVTEFVLGDLPKVGETQPYTQLALRRFVFQAKGKDAKGSDVNVPATDMSAVTVALGKGASHEGSSQAALPTFAEKAADAPIVHLDGPLTLRIPPNPKNEPCTYLMGVEGEQTLTVQMGTLGPVGGTWAPLGYELVGEDIHPQVEITYPPAKAGGTPIVVKFALDDRC